MRTLAAVLLLAIAAFAVLSLASGARYLTVTLPGGLPFGNVLTAIGLCAVACTAIALSAPATKLQLAALGALFAALAWLPVSIALAGNLSLNFSGESGAAWLAFSLALVAVLIGILIWSLAAAWSGRGRHPAALMQEDKEAL